MARAAILEFSKAGPVPKMSLFMKQYYVRDPENPYVFLLKRPACKHKGSMQLGCCGGRPVRYCRKQKRILEDETCWKCKDREE